MLALTITHAFGNRTVGETITDRDEIEAALASNPHSVVRINLLDPEPAASAKTAPVSSASAGTGAKSSAA